MNIETLYTRHKQEWLLYHGNINNSQGAASHTYDVTCTVGKV